MFFSSFLKVFKGVNELYCFFAFLGIIFYFFFSSSKEKKMGLLILLLSFFMIIVRCVFLIRSSRYASILIIPTSFFAAYFMICKCNNNLFIFSRGALFFLFIFLIFRKDYISSSFHSNSHDIAEAFCLLNKGFPGKFSNIVNNGEYERINYFTNRMIDYEVNERDPASPSTYLEIYNNTFRDTLVFFPQKRGSQHNNTFSKMFYKELVSTKPSRDSKTIYKLYLFKSKTLVIPISKKNIPSYSDNLLKNGNLELIDSETDSYKKFIKHISGYSDHFSSSSKFRTASDTYFYCNIDSDELPLLNISSVNPIQGKYSAHIVFDNGYAFLLFYQRFHNGKYLFSYLIKGKTNTVAWPVCLIYQNKKWRYESLSSYRITDKRLFLFSTQFSLESLRDDDFFLIGVMIRNGEATLDNFVLQSI